MPDDSSKGKKEGYVLIYRASKTDPKTQKTIYARDYGLRGFPILVPKKSAA